MPHITFSYSITKDTDNWIRRFYDQKNTSFAPAKDIIKKYPPALVVKMQSAKNRKEASKVVRGYLQNDLKNGKKMPLIKQELKAARGAWKLRENDFFAVLQNLLERPLYTEKFNAYLTTFFRCPYSENENWFMVNFWSSLPEQMTTVAHEILHLQFLNQYRLLLETNGLNENQIQNLKEALTFILNEKEFFSILLKPDSGYEEHAILRKNLKNLWNETRAFHLFLPEAIKIIKKTPQKVNSSCGAHCAPPYHSGQSWHGQSAH